jgi:hypothetical protein
MTCRPAHHITSNVITALKHQWRIGKQYNYRECGRRHHRLKRRKLNEGGAGDMGVCGEISA